MVIYKEWISVEKKYFKILIMISEKGGSFTGNLSDIYRTITRKPSSAELKTKTRNEIKASLEYLESNKFINIKTEGRNYTLTINPLGNPEVLSDVNYEKLRNYNFKGKISWEETLRVYLWLYFDSISGEEKEYITQSMIECDLHISTSTIGVAEKHLESGLGAIVREKIPKIVGTDDNGNSIYHRLGHKVTLSAFWI